jgi:hypothetical protein
MYLSRVWMISLTDFCGRPVPIVQLSMTGWARQGELRKKELL